MVRLQRDDLFYLYGKDFIPLGRHLKRSAQGVKIARSGTVDKIGIFVVCTQRDRDENKTREFYPVMTGNTVLGLSPGRQCLDLSR